MRKLVLVVGLAACGADPTETVTVDAEGLAYLAARDQGGDWRPLTPAADLEVEVNGAFSLAGVCTGDGFFNFYTIHAAPEDQDSGWLDFRCVAPEVETVTVTIAPEQLGGLYIDNRRSSGASTMTVEAGVHDVIAIDGESTPPRVAIVRGVDLTADATVFVDLAADGVPMIEATIATDATDASGVAILTTASGTRATSPFTFTATAWLFPSSVTVPTDVQRVSASALAVTGTRGASKVIAGTETTIELTLPAGMASATRTTEGELSFAWESTDPWQERYGYYSSDDGLLFDVMTLPGYVAATGSDATLTLAAPAELPAWDETWTIAAGLTPDWGIGLLGELDDQSQSAFLDLIATDAARRKLR